jgi:hypothetical protein
MGRDWEKKDGRELQKVKEGLEGGTRWASGGGCPVYVWVWRGIPLGNWRWRSALSVRSGVFDLRAVQWPLWRLIQGLRSA